MSDASAGERRALFHDTAKRFYRLVCAPEPEVRPLQDRGLGGVRGIENLWEFVGV